MVKKLSAETFARKIVTRDCLILSWIIVFPLFITCMFVSPDINSLFTKTTFLREFYWLFWIIFIYLSFFHPKNVSLICQFRKTSSWQYFSTEMHQVTHLYECVRVFKKNICVIRLSVPFVNLYDLWCITLNHSSNKMLSYYQSAKVVILSERRFQFHSLEKGVEKKVLNTSVGLKDESASGGRGVRFFLKYALT